MSCASAIAVGSAVSGAYLAIRLGVFGKNRIELRDTAQVEHHTMVFRSLLVDELSISKRDRVGHFIMREHGEIIPGYFLPSISTKFFIRPVKCKVVPYDRAEELDAMMKESCTEVTKTSVAQLRERVEKF